MIDNIKKLTAFIQEKIMAFKKMYDEIQKTNPTRKAYIDFKERIFNKLKKKDREILFEIIGMSFFSNEEKTSPEKSEIKKYLKEKYEKNTFECCHNSFCVKCVDKIKTTSKKCPLCRSP